MGNLRGTVVHLSEPLLLKASAARLHAHERPGHEHRHVVDGL